MEKDRCSSCGADLRPTGPGLAVCAPCAFGLALAGPGGDEDPEPGVPGATEAGGSGWIGPYRLLRVLGEGGMGIVWEAAQTEPVRRRVALKQIRAGLDSAQVLSRFEQERQALALMGHPNIAQVLDAGRAADGRPYFAMEHIEGPWVTRWCDAERLGVSGRLAIFLEICDGVQHAHRKGIIHRDIKPSNVLVQTVAGRPTPKIIDFGVAKAMGADVAERSLLTRLGQLVGTPEYISPEQAGPAGHDVDTRTDVYSLGVLLYELLCGRLPFEADGGDPDALRRRIREAEPARPSARAREPGSASLEIAARRGADPVSLSRRLRGDLDWIVMRALEKDRGRRYGSPEDLAADIRRHLASEPVLAGPPTAGYRVSRFVRRHTLAVAAGSTIAVLLIATAAGASILAGRLAAERDRANREARTAEAALGFLTETFRLADPELARGETITAREILDRGAANVERELRGDPGVQAILMGAIGRTYANLGLHERAEPLARRAVEIRTASFGAGDPATLESRLDLASLRRELEAFEEAESLAREVLEAASALEEDEEALAARASQVLGEILVDRGRLEEAEPLLRAAFDEMTRALGPEDRRTLEAAASAAGCLSRRGKYEEARPILERTLEARRRIDGNDSLETVHALNYLAIALARMERFPEAEPLYLEALATLRRVAGDDHPSTVTLLSNLGGAYLDRGDLDAAEPLLREALDTTRRTDGPASLSTLSAMTLWGSLLRERGRLAEAEEAFRAAMVGLETSVGRSHPKTMRALYNLGHVLQMQGRLAEAEPHLRGAAEAAASIHVPDHPTRLLIEARLGSLLVQRGLHEEALPILATALAGYRKRFPPGHPDIGVARRVHGDCLAGLRRFEEAETALLEAHGILDKAAGEADDRTRAAARSLAALYEAWGRPGDAAAWNAAGKAEPRASSQP